MLHLQYCLLKIYDQLEPSTVKTVMFLDNAPLLAFRLTLEKAMPKLQNATDKIKTK